MGMLGTGGCILIKGGVTKLSQLEIDVDKDWQGFGITNLKELAAGQAIGSVLFCGASGVLESLSPGTSAFELFTKGIGNAPKWDSY
jgi:hypothetical protein